MELHRWKCEYKDYDKQTLIRKSSGKRWKARST